MFILLPGIIGLNGFVVISVYNIRCQIVDKSCLDCVEEKFSQKMLVFFLSHIDLKWC